MGAWHGHSNKRQRSRRTNFCPTDCMPQLRKAGPVAAPSQVESRDNDGWVEGKASYGPNGEVILLQGTFEDI